MSDQIPVEFDEEVEEIDPFDMICGDDISRIPETSKPDFECNKESAQEEKVEESVEEQAEEVSESIEEIDPFDMITGDDISRIPETTKPDFECNKEEEKPSYAAVARSRPTSECNPDEPVVEDVEDPVVEDVTPVQATPVEAEAPKAAPVEAEEQKQSRSERKTKKAMMKLGLTAVEGINRVVLRKDKTLLFVVPNPEVFRKGDTWVVLGEARVEDPNQRAREMAAAKVAENIQPKTKTEPVQATITEEDEETDVPADGVEEKDIELVMQQAACTRAKAISALKSNSNDIVNAIMELTL